MITATEAKVLYDKSGQEVSDYLEYTVEHQVIKAAEGGKRRIIIHLKNLVYYEHLDKVITPLQKAIVDRLKELGYGAEIKLYDNPYVPAGLANDEGRGPSHQNYGIHISW